MNNECFFFRQELSVSVFSIYSSLETKTIQGQSRDSSSKLYHLITSAAGKVCEVIIRDISGEMKSYPLCFHSLTDIDNLQRMSNVGFEQTIDNFSQQNLKTLSNNCSIILFFFATHQDEHK